MALKEKQRPRERPEGSGLTLGGRRAGRDSALIGAVLQASAVGIKHKTPESHRPRGTHTLTADAGYVRVAQLCDLPVAVS